MKPVRNFIITISIILFASCGDGRPYVTDYTTQRPRFTDVVGIYQFQEQSVSADSAPKEFRTSFITFNANGRYVLHNFGDFSNGRIISTGGQWEMKVDTVETEWGNKMLHWGVALNPDPGLPFIGFLGSSPPYKLILNYSDIDLGQVIIFSKK